MDQNATQPRAQGCQFLEEGQGISSESPEEKQSQVKTKRARCTEYDKLEVMGSKDTKTKMKPMSRKPKVTGNEILDYIRKQDAFDKSLGAEAINTPRTKTSLAHFFSPKSFHVNDGDQNSTLTINS